MQYAPPAAGFTVDQLSRALGSCSLQPIEFAKGSSRVFLAPSRKVAPDGGPVDAQLACIFDSFKTEFSATLNQVFHYLHQRLAPANSISGKHEQKAAELVALDSKMKCRLG